MNEFDVKIEKTRFGVEARMSCEKAPCDESATRMTKNRTVCHQPVA
jgi:hypothetical protein